MDDLIKISQLNDFIFCPISIYFHNLYYEQSTVLYQNTYQTNGKYAHKNVDVGKYSSKKDIISGIDVYCDKYSLTGKIDILDGTVLIERKKCIKKIYDGYVFQLYGQYFALIEMGYKVNRIALHSMDDNKTYPISLPSEDSDMYEKFEILIGEIKSFRPEGYVQFNAEKCRKCIYEPACDRSLQ